MTTVRFGALDPQHRGRLAEILAATGVFSVNEVGVALELFDETFGGGRNEEGGTRAPSSVLPPPSSSYEFLGLFADDTLTGYACYGATPGTDGTFDLYWIALHPPAQGAGDGTRLLCEVERRLRQQGGRLLIAETSSRPAYARTRRFYEARGYRQAARVADFYAPADDLIIYTKRLTGAETAGPQSLQPSEFARSASP